MISQFSELTQNLTQNLNKNQKLLAIIGSVFFLALLLYTILWLPFSLHVDNLHTTVNKKKSLEKWMLSASQEANYLKQLNLNGSPGNSGKSLLSIVDNSAKMANLQDSVKRTEPDKENKVKIRLEQVGFDDMVVWLEKLSIENNINVVTISVDSQQTTGIVNTRVTLAGPVK